MNGKKNGKGNSTFTVGTLTYAKGGKYEGEFKNDARNGEGTFLLISGREETPGGGSYEGQWKNDLRNGTGTLTYPNGDVYHGEWVDDRRQGKGKGGNNGRNDGIRERGQVRRGVDEQRAGASRYTLCNAR